MSSVAATIIPAVASAGDLSKAPKQAYYELKIYTCATNGQQQAVLEHYEKAAIPALNRAGIQKVGVFIELEPEEVGKVYVLTSYNNLDDLEKVNRSVEHDAVFLQQGAAYLNAPASAPVYERIESSVLKAFTEMPVMEIPEQRSRIFELRQYQSASEKAGAKKIEMFNEGGEVAIFKRLGFRPVFFGETIIGSLRPNLTYMVTFDDKDAVGKHWKAFGSDAEWKKISAIPENADKLLVSKIVSTFIKPADFSQI